MIWVKLDCLKSNGKLETMYSLDTTVKVKTRRQQSEVVGLRNPPCREQGSVRPIKPRKDTLSHPDNVIHDRTAGSPKGREP